MLTPSGVFEAIIALLIVLALLLSVGLPAAWLLWAGAAGNLWDRVRSPRGVVDFIDVGLGGWRFWIFNVADVAITLGAVLLAVTLAREDRARSAG